MKISKKPKAVQACNEVIAEEVPAVVVESEGPVVEAIVEVEPSAYEQAACYVKSAIESLTVVADSDLARDVIANLSVVLLELNA